MPSPPRSATGRPLTEHFEIRTRPGAADLAAARATDPELAAGLRSNDTHGGTVDSWLYAGMCSTSSPGRTRRRRVLDTLRPLQFRDYSIASSRSHIRIRCI